MFHLLRIEEISLLDTDGTVLWRDGNINNLFHLNGQEYLLNVAFNSSSGIMIPASYYAGLDNRTTLAVTDTLANLSQEPTQFGYARQAISSLNGFTVTQNDDGNYRAASGILIFSASGGTWGPVKNIFLATTTSNSGYLLSSAELSGSRTVQSGQSLTMRLSLGLVNC